MCRALQLETKLASCRSFADLTSFTCGLCSTAWELGVGTREESG